MLFVYGLISGIALSIVVAILLKKFKVVRKYKIEKVKL